MSFPGRQKAAKLLVATLMVAGAPLVLEGAVRSNGDKPWDPRSKQIGERAPKVEPGGILFQRDEKLGFASLPGTFRVTQARHAFRATNLDRMHRALWPPGITPSTGPRPGVWVFGDSTTYGWGVDDELAYVALLQQRHPELEVRNFAIGGYSTTQSLIQLEETLAGGATPPRVAVLAYASSHAGRNLMLRNNRKEWFGSDALTPVLPAARVEGGKLEYGLVSMAYEPWPLMRSSALVNKLETLANKAQVLTQDANGVSRALLTRFAEICRAHGTTFVLAGAAPDSRTDAVLRWAGDRGIPTVSIAADLELPGNALPDKHPSPKAHQQMANALEPVVLRELEKSAGARHAAADARPGDGAVAPR
jgi:lysophospholipase L1-like esterase